MTNRVETRIVIDLLKHIVSERPELVHDMSVIVPYRNHIEEILKAINEEQELSRWSEDLEQLMATIDSFQGQEKDLIVVLFTRSNRKGEIGFLQERRRLNVALSRAKRQMLVIGNMRTLKNSKRDERDLASKQVMEQLYRYCDSRGLLLKSDELDRRLAAASPEWGLESRTRGE